MSHDVTRHSLRNSSMHFFHNPGPLLEQCGHRYGFIVRTILCRAVSLLPITLLPRRASSAIGMCSTAYILTSQQSGTKNGQLLVYVTYRHLWNHSFLPCHALVHDCVHCGRGGQVPKSLGCTFAQRVTFEFGHPP